MPDVDRFIREHFVLLFGFTALWLLVFICWRFYRHRKDGIRFPPLDSVHRLFHEGMASGCSHRSVWTRFGGARRCLRVTVTDREVWIRPFFPFSLLAQTYDLEHRISRGAISSVQLSGSGFFRSVLLDYRHGSGTVRRIQLRLRNPDGFLAALKGPPPLP